MGEGKIKIWYEPGRSHGLRWYQEPAYCWQCPCCGPRCRGRNSFNRFTDTVRIGRSTYRHPYQRCWDAIELHLWRHHRDLN